MRSSYWLFLFKLRWVRQIWNFISNPFWKENCWYPSEASPAIVMISYICTDIIVSKAEFRNMVRKRAAVFQVWNNQEIWKFRSCTVKNNYFWTWIDGGRLRHVGPAVVPRFETWGKSVKKPRFHPPLTVTFFCFINALFVGLYSFSFLRTDLAFPFRRWLSFQVCSLCPWWEWQTWRD